MYIPVTYEQDFDDLWMHLKSKYPEKLFNLDGVGEQLDMSKFSKKFFSSAVTSDASIDANANVDDMSVIAYEKELPKPFLKMNSYYILWKELKKLYGRPFADSVVEMQLTGDIYINDMHGIGAGKPYSYFGDTVIIAKTPNGAILYTTMEDVFNRVAHDGQLGEREDCEEYTPEKGWEILDNNGWTKLTRILKHPSHCDLVGVETKNGRTTIVTEDHPVILKGNQCLAAEDLCCGIHELAQGSLRIDQGVTTSFIDPDYAYFVGFMIGDGYIVSIPGKVTQIRSGHFEICQKNIKNHKIWSVANRLYDNVREIKQGRALACGYKADVELLGDTGRKSHKRKMPADVLFWGKDAQLSLLAGLIDAEANINPNGIVSIRVSSFALAEQIAELIRLNNLGNCRTQLIKEYAPSGFASNHPLYGVSCRFTDRDIAKYSIKIQQSYDAVYKKVNVDGRFDSNDYRVHKLLKYQHFGNAVYDVTTASGHFYSQGLLQHNCFNYSTYDILTKGLPMVKKVKCEPPKYLYSFKSQLEQFVTIASNSTLGASGTADMLIMMAYYVKNMLNTLSDAHFTFADEDAVWRYVRENLVSFVYTINQPMRGNQSPFTNLSIYDDNFLDKLCGDYIFPDGSTPDKEIVKKLQDIYLDIMNEELARTPLTFPVTTACFSIDKDNNIQDEEFLHNIAQKNLQWGFINMYAGSSSTLSSCCRLRSEQQSEYFNSFGSGSSKIGSLGVCTINFPRLAIQYPLEEDFMEKLEEMVGVCAKVNNAKRHIVQKRINNGNEPLYKYEFMELSKQYSTCGVNGFYEAIQLLGYDILTEEGQALALRILDKINDTNKVYQNKYKMPHNVEQVPGENLSIKLAEKDKLMGYQNEYNLYSNQFIPLIANADLFDRIKLQGLFDSHFSGGSICHLNVETQIADVKDMEDLIRVAAKKGVVYFAINYVLSQCTNGHMSVTNGDKCLVCGEPITDKYSRVVGFLTNIKNWHKVRRDEDFPNRQFYQGEEIAPPAEEIEKVDLVHNAKEGA